MEPIIELQEAESTQMTLRDLLQVAQDSLGEETVLEFDQEVVVEFECLACGNLAPVFMRMARLYETEFACPKCGNRREMHLTHRIDGSEAYLNRTLSDFDIPQLGIIRARNGEHRAYFEITGDKGAFLTFN